MACHIIVCVSFALYLQDQVAVIKKAAAFLGKSVTDEQVLGLCDHLKFSRMAANPSVNMQLLLTNDGTDPNSRFIRKGKVGDWTNYMSQDLARRFDEWTDEHLRGTGLRFHTDVIPDEE